LKALSVIVCTHNPAPEPLRRVLDALAAQTLPREQWELLLIDNASAQCLADHWDIAWHPRGRHVREDTLGLTPARLRGIAEARGDVLVYVDDDNVLDAAYLQTAAALFDAHTHLGAIGCGCLEAEYEVPPSRAVAPHLSLLSRDVAQARWSSNASDFASVPWGAGLGVTREVALAYIELLRRMNIDELLDRRGEHLFGNGDVAFSWSAVTIGQGFGVFPQLRIQHLIPARRMTRAYLLRYVRDSSFSGGVSDFLRTGRLPGNGNGRIEAVLRLALRGLRRGPFASRIGWAELRGTEQAREYIRARRLQPLARDLHQAST
jgi:glycosyltransferase involved in cell wall biosynthesis